MPSRVQWTRFTKDFELAEAASEYCTRADVDRLFVYCNKLHDESKHALTQHSSSAKHLSRLQFYAALIRLAINKYVKPKHDPRHTPDVSEALSRLLANDIAPREGAVSRAITKVAYALDLPCAVDLPCGVVLDVPFNYPSITLQLPFNCPSIALQLPSTCLHLTSTCPSVALDDPPPHGPCLQASLAATRKRRASGGGSRGSSPPGLATRRSSEVIASLDAALSSSSLLADGAHVDAVVAALEDDASDASEDSVLAQLVAAEAAEAEADDQLLLSGGAHKADLTVFPSPNAFRTRCCYTEAATAVLLESRETLKNLFDALSASIGERGLEKRLLSLPEWLGFVRQACLVGPDLSDTDAVHCFMWSRMVVVDTSQHRGLTRSSSLPFESFLEALVRDAHRMPPLECLSAADCQFCPRLPLIAPSCRPPPPLPTPPPPPR